MDYLHQRIKSRRAGNGLYCDQLQQRLCVTQPYHKSHSWKVSVTLHKNKGFRQWRHGWPQISQEEFDGFLLICLRNIVHSFNIAACDNTGQLWPWGLKGWVIANLFLACNILYNEIGVLGCEWLQKTMHKGRVKTYNRLQNYSASWNIHEYAIQIWQALRRCLNDRFTSLGMVQRQL